MTPQKQIELFVYLHSIRNGVVSVSPQPSIARQAHLPIHKVEIECADQHSSKVLIRLPEYLAIMEGLIQQSSVVMSDRPGNRIAENGGQLAKLDPQRHGSDTAGESSVKPVAPAPLIPPASMGKSSVMTDAPTPRSLPSFDQLSESQQEDYMKQALAGGFLERFAVKPIDEAKNPERFANV